MLYTLGRLLLAIVMVLLSSAGCAKDHPTADARRESVGVAPLERENEDPRATGGSRGIEGQAETNRPERSAAMAEDCIIINESFSSRCSPRPTMEREKPFLSNAETKRVTWASARKWWRHGELLRAEWLPRSESRESRESLYALPNGTGTNSVTHRSSISIFYEYSSVSVDQYSYWQFVDEGGISIKVTFSQPGTPVPVDGSIVTKRARQIQVRGHRARMLELRKSKGDGNNWREVYWIVFLEDGGFVEWSIGNHPDLYTSETTIAFINRLASV